MILSGGNRGHKGMFLIAFAIKTGKQSSIKAEFQSFVETSIRSETFACFDNNKPGWNFRGPTLGTQFSSQILIDFPSPTLQKTPLEIRSLAAMKLRHIKEGLFPNSASKKEDLGKYLALENPGTQGIRRLNHPPTLF
jgi:hypothetical protein